jgi:hypothetical protein
MPSVPIDLGTLLLNSPAASRPVTLRNTGNAPLTIQSVSVGSPFSVANGCPAMLEPEESCVVSVGLDPTQLGTFSANLSVVTDAPGGSRSVQVRAMVQPRPEPIIRVSPSSIGFGARLGTTESPPQRVTIFNEGGADAAELAVAIDMPHFRVLNTSCTPILAAQTTCFADVVFGPIGYGPKRGTLRVTSNAPTASVGLSGAGCRPPTVSAGRTPGLNCSP